MSEAQTLLNAHKIFLPDYSPGRRYSTCPQCSPQRQPQHQKLKCLGVTIVSDGAGSDRCWWGCNHCGWHGPLKGAASAEDTGGFGTRHHLYGQNSYKVRTGRPQPKFVWKHYQDGKFVNGADPADKIGVALYRFAEAWARAIALNVPISIVEGEKDVDTLMALDIPATCSAHGAAQPEQEPKWYAGHSAQLKGIAIAVFNDNDAQGYAHAAATVRLSRGIAEAIYRIDLKDHWPGEMPEGADVTDFINAGAGDGDFIKQLIAEAQPVGDDAGAGEDGPDQWRERAHLTDKGTLVDNYFNAHLFVSNHPGTKDAFTYDSFAAKPFVVHQIGEPAQRHDPVPVSDNILRVTQRWVQDVSLRKTSIQNITAAVLESARARSFDPVLDWLNSLTWDGVARLDTWTSTYLSAEDNEVNRFIGKLLLVQIVARQYQPGCKADYMVVLEGDQGIFKSMVCAILGGPWFSDNLPDLTKNEKDAQMHLLGKLVIEVAELHAFGRADATHLKSFVTRQSERFRPPYGIMEVEQPRRGVFIGTTNMREYFKDPTGNRRYLPLAIGRVDVAALRRDRDQLFAEAIIAYRGGAKWWPDAAFERAHLKPLQESRYDHDDAWADPISSHLGDRSETTITECLEALQFVTNGNGGGYDPHHPEGYASGGQRGTPINKASKADQNRVKNILDVLGFVRTSERNALGRQIYRRRRDA